MIRSLDDEEGGKEDLCLRKPRTMQAPFKKDQSCCRFNGCGTRKATPSRAERVPWPLRDQGTIITAQESIVCSHTHWDPYPFIQSDL